MFVTYLLISVIVYMIFFGVTYGYHRYYSKQVNLRLKNKKQSSLIHPTKFFLLLILGSLVLTIMINIFPILKIKDTVVNDDNRVHYSLESNDYYTQFDTMSIIDDYDISYNDEGMYVIAFGNDKSVSGFVNEVMDAPFTIYSRIVLFDQYENIVWDTQDLSANNYELIYDNHMMDARAIEFLNDGHIVVFGLSIDLDTNIVYQTVVILDIFGNLVELIDLDISDYGFTQWGGHDDYDVVATDQGFTVEYDTTFRGSVMVHFNEDYDYEWYVINDDNIDGVESQGIPEEVYLDTLVYKNQAYYILNDSTIKKYDESGTLIWENTYNDDITGFDVFDDEIVILSRSSEEHVVRDGLFKLKDRMRNVLYINVIRMDTHTGEMKDTYAYQYDQIVKDTEIVPVLGHYTLKDELGNYYVLIHEVPSSRSHLNGLVYLIMTFDTSFEYKGFSTIHIEDMISDDLIQLLFKTHNYIEDDLLYINGVLVENRAIIVLNELSYSEEDMSINIGFYNNLLTLRVYMVNVMLYLLIGLIAIIFPVYYHFTKNDDEVYVDEDLLREKYGSP